MFHYLMSNIFSELLFQHAVVLEKHFCQIKPFRDVFMTEHQIVNHISDHIFK